MRIVEKSQLMSAPEIDRTLQRLAHEIVEKSGERYLGPRAAEAPLAERAGGARAPRNADRGDVHRAQGGDQRHGNYRSAAARDRQRRTSRARGPRGVDLDFLFEPARI